MDAAEAESHAGALTFLNLCVRITAGEVFYITNRKEKFRTRRHT